MSAVTVEKSGDIMLCASCGAAGSDDIKLKKCTACHLVRYCSVKCQKEHRSKHKKACKKRAAELHDEILFKQPESNHYGDCPICCLPMANDPSKSIYYLCCSMRVCIGCDNSNQNREIERSLEQKCPFCREPLPEKKEEAIKLLMKRIEANDPAAMCEMGTERYHEGDYKSAFDYWTTAAKLGDGIAHYQLSILYGDGKGVEVEKDENEGKELYHAEQAAIRGNPYARRNVGRKEWKDGQHARAAKHFIIAAKLGDDESLEFVKNLYKEGFVSKENFAAALRGHQAAIDATKSPQREEAEKWRVERERDEAL